MHEVFDRKYKSLNPAQREAVDTIFGPVMVVAGPGTGKTTLLTLRIANILLKTDTRPEQILALTFTESGVKAMKEKLREIIGSDALKVNIYTYHSFAEQILRRYNDYFAEFNNFRFFSEDESISLFESIIDSGEYERIKSTFSPYFQVKNIIGYIKELKREFIDPKTLALRIDSYEDLIKADPDNYSSRGKTKGEIKSTVKHKFKMVDKMRELVEVYEEYESKKRLLRFYDFEDIINEVVKKIQTEDDLRFEIAEEYQFVLADEHQDANTSQNKILDFFGAVDTNPNLMVVGDEKQAIFRFQGGTLENFVGFKTRYKEAKLITLTSNYRSHQNILDYSHDLMSKRADLLINKDNLRAEGSAIGDGHITFASLYDKESESEYIGERIKELLEQSKDETIAVIYRQNKEKDSIARILDILGISYSSFSDNELFEDRYALEFVTCATAMADFYDNNAMMRLLASSVFNLDILKIHTINKEISNGKNAFDVISNSDDEEVSGIVEKLKNLSSIALKKSPVEFVEEFARNTDYLKTDDAKILGHKLAILRSFSDIAKQVIAKQEDATIKELNNFIEKATQYDMKVTIPKDSLDTRVNLMTAHKSKGLEFDHVFIVNLTQSDWGESKHRNNFISLDVLMGLGEIESTLEDTRKLLYVAMTRAKKTLTLTFPKLKIDGKSNEESGFIGEIRDDLIHRVEIQKKATLKFMQKEIPKAKVEFYRDVFLSSSFSVSSLNNYLECSNKFLFNNLLRFPFALNLSLLVGDATHEALENYGNLILRKKQHGGLILFNLFEKSLGTKPLRVKDLKSVIKEYRESLIDLGDSPNLPDGELYKVEYRLEHTYKVTVDSNEYEVFIRGYVDRVDKRGDGLYVVDFKTGKPKSRNQVAGLTESSDGNYLRQIVFYKMIMEAMDKDAHINAGQICFVLRDENQKRVYHEFELTSEMVIELKNDVDRVLREIITGEFLLKGCGEKDCEYCKLRRMIDL